MTTIPLSDAKARLSQVVRDVRTTGEPVVITVDGIPAVELRPLPQDPARGGEVREFWALLALIQAQADEGEPFDAVALVREGRR